MGTLTITGGTLRSRRVPTPPGRATRPTPARVKEALFSILGARVADARVLDLFAGSGALGFEALSRGAAHVTFVERHRPTADALARAARELGVDDRVDGHRRAGRARRAQRRRAATTSSSPTRPTPSRIRPRRCARCATRHAIDRRHDRRLRALVARSAAGRSASMRAERSERYGEVALTFLRPLEDAA